MKALVKVFLILIVNFTISKDINDSMHFYRNDMLNLSSIYDYKINFYIERNRFPSFSEIYFFIATELYTIPFDITYSFRGADDIPKNISIYHKEKKGKYNSFFFKFENPKDDIEIIDFNVSNIKGEYALLVNSFFEELNSNIVKIENSLEPKSIEIHKDLPIFILFDIQEFKYPTFQITVPSFIAFKKNFFFGGSKEEINDISILNRRFYLDETSYIVYDNKTYEFYPDSLFEVWMKFEKNAYVILQPLVDANITFHAKDRTNVLSIDETEYNIGKMFYLNFIFEQFGVKINFNNYYQNLFYFTIMETHFYKYYYSYKTSNQIYASNPIELKNIKCKVKKNYEYCEANRTTEDQNSFYFIAHGNTDGHNALFFSSTYFDESNYNIIDPHVSYEYKLNKTNPLFPAVIGNFEPLQTLFLEFEIEFPENDYNENNNIKNIDITLQINNKGINDYLIFSFENSGFSLDQSFSTVNKYYYLYFQSIYFIGIKSLFFFIYNKGKNPNCTIKFSTFEELEKKYENNLILLNQEKKFSNKYEIFFLTLNLTKVSFSSNDNINITFKANKNAFKNKNVYYYYSTSSTFNYNINGNYSICQTQIKKDEEDTIISCLISKTSNNPLYFILYLNQDYDINVYTEIVNIVHFNNTLSCDEGRKYIITNNAFINDNYYIFRASNNNFNLEDIKHNFINSLGEFSEDFPILENKVIQTSDDIRFYINLKNFENKKLISFKSDKIKIPFQIIKTNFDESKTIFLYECLEQKEFDVMKNEELLFVIKLKDASDKLFFKFISDFNDTYFNSMKYYQSSNAFQSFSNINMNELDDNVFKIFHAENKMILYKEIPKSSYFLNCYISFIFNQTISGKIKYELLKDFNNFYDINLNDNIPYKLKKGVNYITSNLHSFKGYYFIFKYPNSISADNIEIYLSDGDFKYYQNYIYNCTLDIKKDDAYIYYFVNFNEIHYFIIFCNIDSNIIIRQSNINENNVEKLLNLDENTIEIQNTNKIYLIGLNPENSKYYFKYIVDSKYKNQLISKYYLEYKDIDNIIDFFEKDLNNIKLSKIFEYEDKTEYYLETNNFWKNSIQTAVFMFQYYNGNHTLNVNLSLSENSFFSFNCLNLSKSENNTFLINNKIFLIDLNTQDFNLGELILYEFKGNKSAFNSTKVYIQTSSDNTTITFSIFNSCNVFDIKNDIILRCNYTKTKYTENILLMLLLNEGNQILIINNNPKEEENRDDDKEEETPDNDKENNKNKKLKYLYYIGLTVIGIILIVVVILFIKNCNKNKNIKEDNYPSSPLIKELNNI